MYCRHSQRQGIVTQGFVPMGTKKRVGRGILASDHSKLALIEPNVSILAMNSVSEGLEKYERN